MFSTLARASRGALMLSLLPWVICWGSSAGAQTYPNHPLRLIVPFPAGGGVDGVARPFAERLSLALGQTVIIDNRPGAAGNIGAEMVARSTPDGYTLLLGNEFLGTNAAFYKTMRYDPIKDLQAIASVATGLVGLAVNANVPVSNVKELIEYSKTHAVNYSTPGMGTGPHLFGEYLNISFGSKFHHIPYKGSSPAIADTMGGQVEMVITTLAPMVQHVSSKKLNVLAVTGSTRSVDLPGVPTLEQSGLAGFSYEIWYGLFAPVGMPTAVVKRLEQASLQMMSEPTLSDQFKKAGFMAAAGRADQLSDELKLGVDTWARVVKEAHIERE